VESLLNVIYPHYLRPVPPMTIAQFQFDPQQSRPAEAVTVPAGSVLHSRPAGGAVCSFRTCYPATVLPLRVKGAALGSAGMVGPGMAPPDAAAALRIQFETLGGLPAAALNLASLRLFLNGEGSPLHRLFELLFAHACRVQVHPRRPRPGEPLPEAPQSLPDDSIRAVGFEPGEGILPYPDRSFLGYRLLQEYFAYPVKFLFVEFGGLETVSLPRTDSEFELVVFFRDSELREHLPAIGQAVGRDTFQLGCTPAVNLFERLADPIRVTHTATEYRVVPDLHRQSSTEVYSVDKVTSTAPYSERPRPYEPFYSFRHARGDGKDRCFWYAQRRPSWQKDDGGTEVFLSLVDLDFNPTLPATELLSATVTCTNRDLVSRLSWQREWGELEGEGLPMVQARCLVKPTPTVRPPLRGSAQWRLVSHLALNRLSIVQTGGLEALQEILRLYCPDDESARQQIRGLAGLRSQASVSRVMFESGIGFCRGLDVEVEFDEDQFVGSGVYLLACVLERFFGLYSAVNSYSRLTARSRQRKSVVRRWPPRIGEARVL
jgi:type VI secretion system protein ImpG